MSVKNADGIVTWKGLNYCGIRELGFNERGALVLDLWTTPPPEPRGSYFTSIPISPWSYRKDHPGRAAVADNGHEVVFWDDWGARHHIGAPRHILEVLLREAAEQGIRLLKPEKNAR